MWTIMIETSGGEGQSSVLNDDGQNQIAARILANSGLMPIGDFQVLALLQTANDRYWIPEKRLSV